MRYFWGDRIYFSGHRKANLRTLFVATGRGRRPNRLLKNAKADPSVALVPFGSFALPQDDNVNCTGCGTAEEAAEKVRSSTSAAKAANENKAFIAALKALRHPKSYSFRSL